MMSQFKSEVQPLLKTGEKRKSRDQDLKAVSPSSRDHRDRTVKRSPHCAMAVLFKVLHFIIESANSEN
jgi:hypothetical protein